eukprot:CAMPEP_0194294076 /NCGR_PEP_ID=MMETSP0169-20130528/49629_1 /TAXON_ID=218684 /ORGANISM="Corethron pennatum, Strain L29A3" /LENGTH=195 /DNA_ID=CAMNT_0039042819 /DNA_START=95 /DNA_END=682 /DNA_ORIENTATION=-
MTSDDDPGNKNDSAADLFSRFTNPVLDDPFLPLTDASLAQIVASALEVFWINLNHAPPPSWLHPIVVDRLWQPRGAFLAPTLIHGAGLASCWILGALAARAYEEKATDPTIEGYWYMFLSLAKAGVGATGFLILATQLDLLFEFGRWVLPGESTEIDFRLLTAWSEVLNDVVFEAVVLTSVRFYLALKIAEGKEP